MIVVKLASELEVDVEVTEGSRELGVPIKELHEPLRPA